MNQWTEVSQDQMDEIALVTDAPVNGGDRSGDWMPYNPPPEARILLNACPSLTVAGTVDELIDAACGDPRRDYYQVAYEVAGRGAVVEATVARVRNGISANYLDPYMRCRDPDCLVVADDLPSDKPTFRERFGKDFAELRGRTFTWLRSQPLTLFGFHAGKPGMGMDALVIAPTNAAFFAMGLALLQGIIPRDQLPDGFNPRLIVYVAPPFRHTDFEGKQVVVHNRGTEVYEMFSYNLYPGPSAKKGVYGALIDLGEREGWIAPHCSIVRMITPYDNLMTFMHEGASGGGKSEMLEQSPREADGRFLLGVNTITRERQYIEIPRLCTIQPVADDMALCHPSIQTDVDRLRVVDAEQGWFVRVNHIDCYGSDVQLERLTAQPAEPLLFLNVDAVPGSTALIWEHVHDTPSRPCPNPRVVIPRRLMPGVIDEPVTVDIRSFGVRTPPCTRDVPTYGILGMFHVLPPALAWLWRLVSPRGHDSPSIIQTEGMGSEGVGAYWPFAPGRRVRQANLLLEQFQRYKLTRHILCPNQYIGAWKVGFMPQWIAREYLARRGMASFQHEQLRAARCSLLGYSIRQLHVEGRGISRELLQVETQPEVGEQAYDEGGRILREFFLECLQAFLEADLAPLGREIIDCCLSDGTVQDYESLIPTRL